MRRLYRIYYNTYNDDVHERVKSELESKYNARVVDHPSKVNPEFRFIELLLDKSGLEEEIKDLIKNIAETMYVKVEWIDTSR